MRTVVLGSDGFNRTFMELKQQEAQDAQIAALRFNRTFMELKLVIIILDD